MKRLSLVISACALFGVMCLAAQDQGNKKDKKKSLHDPLPPLKVVTLTRSLPVNYEKEIAPILSNKCEVCHSSSLQEGKLDVTDPASLLKGGKSGPAILPGKADESLLIKLAGRTGTPPMPPKDDEPLTPEELALLKLWIAEGAKGQKVVADKPNLQFNKWPARVKPIGALALSPDKTRLAVGQGAGLMLYELPSGKQLFSLVNPQLKDSKDQPLNQAQLDLVQALVFSPDGKQLYSADFQQVHLWDAVTGKWVKSLAGMMDRVTALDISSDGKRLAVASGVPSSEGEAKVFDLSTGNVVTELKQPHTDMVYSVRFSPDGKTLLTCSADKLIRTFSLPEGQLLKTFEGHTGQVLDVAWKADGKAIISVGADNVVKVWSFETGDQLLTIGGHGRQITRLQMIGAKPEIATACGDAWVRFWNVDNGGNIRNFGGNADFLYALTVSSDGTIVVAGGQEGVVRVYNGTNGQITLTLTPGK